MATNKPLLSILIPTLEKRFDKIDCLLRKIEEQRNKYLYLVEIGMRRDDGTMNIGEKRQWLIDHAQGEYCIQIDDDDDISSFFLDTVIPVLQRVKPDCIGSYEAVVQKDAPIMLAKHSMIFKEWADNVFSNERPYHYERSIFNKDIIRTDICRAIGFDKSLRFGEDLDFANRLAKSGLLKKEAFIETPVLYIYHAPTFNNINEHNLRYGI